MKLQDSLYKMVFDGLDVGVFIIDAERTVTYWSQAADALTGFSSEEIVGSVIGEAGPRFLDDDGHSVCGKECSFIGGVLETGDPAERRLEVVKKDGAMAPVLVRLTPVRDEEKAVIGAVLTFIDLTVQESAIESIKDLRDRALIDPLTRMANRRFTETTIRERLEELNRYGKTFGLLFIDLDLFKEINDRFGTDVGDLVLQKVTKMLNKHLRPFDFVGRWGGDELVALLVNVTYEQLPRIAERVRRLIMTAVLPQVAEFPGITASIGGTLSRKGDSVTSILKRVDTLMFRSKQGGRNRVTIDDPPPEAEGLFLESF